MLFLFKFILEGYDNLAVVSTEKKENQNCYVTILVSEQNKERLENIIKEVKNYD